MYTLVTLIGKIPLQSLFVALEITEQLMKNKNRKTNDQFLMLSTGHIVCPLSSPLLLLYDIEHKRFKLLFFDAEKILTNY